MKFSKIFKKNVCHAVMLGFISQLFGTFALAVGHSNPTKWESQIPCEQVALQKNGLDALIMEIVHQAASLDMNGASSQALMRCYERIIGGYETVLVEDVMAAMPELLHYALLKYENTDTTNITRARPAQASDSRDQKAHVEPVFDYIVDEDEIDEDQVDVQINNDSEEIHIDEHSSEYSQQH